MTIPLDQFESLIDETILKRGLSYFKSGKVIDVEERGMGIYHAVVDGNEPYSIRLALENNIITDHSCSCPYDMGPVCKHVVAVIFFLLQDELQITPKPKGSKLKATKAGPKKPQPGDLIREILDKTNHEDLKQFVSETALHDKAFADKLILSLAQGSPEDLRPLYKSQLKTILRSAKDRQGFIKWSATHKVVTGLRPILGNAQVALKRGRQPEAFVIATVVMEEMTKAIQFTDDSDGHIGWAIDTALELLHDICKASPVEDLRNDIMTYCIKSFKKGIYKGWDWHVGLIRVAALLARTAKEADTLITLLEEDGLFEIEFNQTQTLIYSLIARFHGPEKASEYIADNLSNPDIRRIAIQQAIDSKDYSHALAITEEGIRADSARWPGLAKEWTDFLLKIAQAQDDPKQVIDNARNLFLENFRNEQDYYGILKQSVPTPDWPAFLESLIAEIRVKRHKSDIHQLAGIFIREQSWDRLLALLKDSPYLPSVDHYATYLLPDYSYDVADLYAQGILDFLDHNVGRNYYQSACRYIRRMKKLGTKDKVQNLIIELRTRYPSRTALLEELNKL